MDFILLLYARDKTKGLRGRRGKGKKGPGWALFFDWWRRIFFPFLFFFYFCSLPASYDVATTMENHHDLHGRGKRKSVYASLKGVFPVERWGRPTKRGSGVRERERERERERSGDARWRFDGEERKQRMRRSS